MRAYVTIFLSALFLSAELVASCCLSSAAGGVARLLKHERALVEISNLSEYTIGHFNDKNQFATSHYPKIPHLVLTPSLQVVTRIISGLDVFLKMPIKLQKSSIRWGSNPGDLSVGLRATLLDEKDPWFRPALSLVSFVQAPTGFYRSESYRPTVEDTSGRGATLLSFALLAEKTIADYIIGLGYGFSFEPRYFVPKGKGAGPSHSPVISLGISLPHEQSLNVSTSMIFSQQLKLPSGLVEHSDTRKLTLSTAYAKAIHSHMKVNAGLGLDVPVSGLGKNQKSTVFFSLGLRIGVF